MDQKNKIRTKLNLRVWAKARFWPPRLFRTFASDAPIFTEPSERPPFYFHFRLVLRAPLESWRGQKKALRGPFNV